MSRFGMLLIGLGSGCLISVLVAMKVALDSLERRVVALEKWVCAQIEFPRKV